MKPNDWPNIKIWGERQTVFGITLHIWGVMDR